MRRVKETVKFAITRLESLFTELDMVLCLTLGDLLFSLATYTFVVIAISTKRVSTLVVDSQRVDGNRA